ncbi:MAG TPA: DUF5680 domain-containing protein [Bacilli bacterium]
MINEKIIEFLVKAKKNTYAGKGPETTPSRPKSHDLIYAEGDYMYYDTYLGGKRFSGEEALWMKSEPVWSMNYSGRVLDESFNGDFLKEALLNVPFEKPFRGPEIFSRGDYTYKSEITGDFEWFQGYEMILYKEKKIYECHFHGGSLSK